MYRYEYTDSLEKLPDRPKFYSLLKNEFISKKYYLHCSNVSNMFKMNIIGDYRDLYLKTGLMFLKGLFVHA